MKFRKILIATAAACLVSASGIAVAQPEMGSHMEGGWHHGEGMEMLHSLNLTAMQKEHAHEIGHTAWTQSKPLMEQMHALHEQVTTQMLASGAATAEQFAPVMQQEQALRAQLDTIHLNTVLQIRALLTPEQLSQAASTHAKMEALHAQEHAVMQEGESD